MKDGYRTVISETEGCDDDDVVRIIMLAHNTKRENIIVRSSRVDYGSDKLGNGNFFEKEKGQILERKKTRR